MLERLDRANLFLVPLDDRRLWYRYHHLFADVLRARLLDEDPSVEPSCTGGRAAWYEHEGDASPRPSRPRRRDHERAADLIELAAPRLRQTRQEPTLRPWLKALPEDVFVDRPVLAMALVGARMVTGETTGVERLLGLVEASLDRPTGRRRGRSTTRSPGSPPRSRSPCRPRAARRRPRRRSSRWPRECSSSSAPDDHRSAARRRPPRARALGVGDLESAEEQLPGGDRGLHRAGPPARRAGVLPRRRRHADRAGSAGRRRRTFEPGLRCSAETRACGVPPTCTSGSARSCSSATTSMPPTSTSPPSLALGESAGAAPAPLPLAGGDGPPPPGRGDLDGRSTLLDDAEPLYDTDFSPPVRPVAALRARVQLARGDVDGAPSVGRGAASRRRTTSSPTCASTSTSPSPARSSPGTSSTGARPPCGRPGSARAPARGRRGGQRMGSAIEILDPRGRAHSGGRPPRRRGRGPRGGAATRRRRRATSACSSTPGPGVISLLLRGRSLGHGAGAPIGDRGHRVDPDHAGPTVDRAPSATRRRAEPPRARRAPPAAQRPERPRDRPRAGRVAQHRAHPHQEHLHEARREQPSRSGAARRRARPARPPRPAATSGSPPRSPHVVMTAHQVRSYVRPVTRTTDQARSNRCRVRDPVAGAPARWSAWFDGLSDHHRGRRHHRPPRPGRRPGRAARPPPEAARRRHPARLAHPMPVDAPTELRATTRRRDLT